MSIVIVHCTCAADGSAERIAQALPFARSGNPVGAPSGAKLFVQIAAHRSPVNGLLQTTRETYPALAARLLELHPYELPEIIAVDVSVAHAPYAEWVAQQVGAP